MTGKRKMEFNIIKKSQEETHGGFGMGTLSLDDVSPVIIDVEAGSASIEIGAMHARSPVEYGIKFLPNKEEVPNGKPYWLVWVTADRKETGLYYAGVTACEMTVDRDIRRGYKNLAEHVNNMDRSMKGRVIVEHMDDKSKNILAQFLRENSEDMWANSPEELKQSLQG